MHCRTLGIGMGDYVLHRPFAESHQVRSGEIFSGARRLVFLRIRIE